MRIQNFQCVFGAPKGVLREEPIASRDGESSEGVGETRLTTGTINTDQLFTGQREMAGLGIYHYGGRFYSPTVGRFLSADTIVPNMANPQDFNRYSYVRNNPIRYTDPSGHVCSDPDAPNRTCESGNPYPNNTRPLPSAPVVIRNPDTGGHDLQQRRPRGNGDVAEEQPTTTTLVTVVPYGPVCQELYCDGPQLISTNVEQVDAFEEYWQDVGEATGLLAVELALVSMAPPAVVVFVANPFVQIASVPVNVAITLPFDAPGTREGDVIVTNAYVIGETTFTCYGETYFTNTMMVRNIYDSDGNLVQSDTQRNTGYCYQR